MKLSNRVAYTPGAQPTDAAGLSHALTMVWDELYRISSYLIESDAPVSAAVRSAGVILPVGHNAYAYQQLFPTGQGNATWERPTGSWANGVWTCPEMGLYQIHASCTIAPIGAAATAYSSVIRIEVAGTGARVIGGYGSGTESMLLTANASGLVTMALGDTVTVQAGGSHPGTATTCTASGFLSIVRVSAVK